MLRYLLVGLLCLATPAAAWWQSVQQVAVGGGPSISTLFATTLYTGNSTVRTITTGVNNAAGSLVWIKARGAATSHVLYDTTRGATLALKSELTDAEQTRTSGLTSFGATGFDLGTSSFENDNAIDLVSWSFLKAAGFFDIVTYTGDASSNQIVNHNLGSSPGLIITKRRDGSGSWGVWNRTFGNKDVIFLESTAAKATYGGADDITVGSTSFTVGNNQIFGNGSGWPYVAYLFAHDTSAGGIVQCGTFTADGSGNATVSGWAWAPQYIIYKATSQAENWLVLDTTRGWASGNDKSLNPNQSSAEDTGTDRGAPTSDGFTIVDAAHSATYIYCAIRAASWLEERYRPANDNEVLLQNVA